MALKSVAEAKRIFEPKLEEWQALNRICKVWRGNASWGWPKSIWMEVWAALENSFYINLGLPARRTVLWWIWIGKEHCQNIRTEECYCLNYGTSFLAKTNNPPEEVMALRNSFLHDISENVTFIQSNADQIIANIVGFDDAFLDMTDD